MSVRKDCFTITLHFNITWKLSKSKQKIHLKLINQYMNLNEGNEVYLKPDKKLAKKATIHR